MGQPDAWGDMREVIARARQEHGDLPCFDELDELVCLTRQQAWAGQGALRAILAIATDELVSIGVLEDGPDGALRPRWEGADVDEVSVVNVAR